MILRRFAQVLTYFVLVNPALGHFKPGKVHEKIAALASSNGIVSSTQDDGQVAIAAHGRYLDEDSEEVVSYDVCKNSCDKVDSFLDLKNLLNSRLSRSAYGKVPVKIGICPSYKPIYWPFDESIIIEDKIKLTLQCCGGSCIIDGGSQLQRKHSSGYDDVEEVTRLFSLISIRNASHVEVKGMTFQNVPSATNSSGSVLSFESSTDLLIADSTFKNIQSQDGAINVHNGQFVGDTNGIVTLADNKFLKCESSGDGGAIKSEGILKMYRNVFRGNHAESQGGSVFCLTGRVFSDSNVYEESTAGNEGGAVFVSGGDFIIKNDLYKKCRAEEGGAVHSSFGKTEISKSKFYDNSATQGGALDLEFGKHSSELNEFKGNIADTGGAIFVDISIHQSSRDVFEYNVAVEEGDDIYLQQSALYYCQTKLLKTTSLGMDSVSLAEKRCGKGPGAMVDNKYKFQCDVIRTFQEFKTLIERQLALSSGSSVRINMCANDAGAAITWPTEEALLFPTKVDFTFNCINGKCSFDGGYKDDGVRPFPAFEFMNVTKIEINNMMFKNFAPVNKTIPPPFAMDAAIFDFDEFVHGSISDCWFENIRTQKHIIRGNQAVDLKIAGNTFLNNKAVDVGILVAGAGFGVESESGFIEATDNIFQGNVAELAFGAIAMTGGFIDSKRNQYIDNITPIRGASLGGLACYIKSTDDIHTNNVANAFSGGALNLPFGLVEVTNSKFNSNKAVLSGGASDSFAVTYLSENSKYVGNMASFGGAISGRTMLIISKNDVFRQNAASGPMDDTNTTSVLSSSSRGTPSAVDLFPRAPGRWEIPPLAASRQVSERNAELNLRTSQGSEEKFGDDVYVENGGAFYWCGSTFSGFLSVIGEVGGDALFKKQCSMSYV